MTRQRIAYIDAMRGLTMILVVYSHVCNYCLGQRFMAFNDVLFLFRLPCFFFISGWLFQHSRDGSFCVASDTERTVPTVLRHKFRVQIIPTVIFLLLLAPPPLFFSRLGATKGGYWFTFALFEYFCIYLFSRWLARRSRHGEWLVAGLAIVISVAAYCYDVYFHRLFSQMGWLTQFLGFLSFMTWRYYLFFYVGTLVRRHFSRFEVWLDSRAIVCLLLFVLAALIPDSDCIPLMLVKFFVSGVSGMFVVFALFRWLDARCPSLFTSRLRILSLIGTRTLDIYLLHYFFMPRFLLPWGAELRATTSSPVQALAALGLALAITAICLMVSRIVRLCPFLAYWLFGAKKGGLPEMPPQSVKS